MLSVGFGDYSAETNFNTTRYKQYNYTIKSDDQLVFVRGRYNKQTNWQTMPFIQFRLHVLVPRYTLDADVCPYLCLHEYLERTKNLRQ
jgi:hypothetical protein